MGLRLCFFFFLQDWICMSSPRMVKWAVRSLDWLRSPACAPPPQVVRLTRANTLKVCSWWLMRLDTSELNLRLKNSIRIHTNEMRQSCNPSDFFSQFGHASRFIGERLWSIAVHYVADARQWQNHMVKMQPKLFKVILGVSFENPSPDSVG